MVYKLLSLNCNKTVFEGQDTMCLSKVLIRFFDRMVLPKILIPINPFFEKKENFNVSRIRLAFEKQYVFEEQYSCVQILSFGSLNSFAKNIELRQTRFLVLPKMFSADV